MLLLFVWHKQLELSHEKCKSGDISDRAQMNDDNGERIKKTPNNNRAWNVDTGHMLIISMIL